MEATHRLPRLFVLTWVLSGLVVNILSLGQQFVLPLRLTSSASHNALLVLISLAPTVAVIAAGHAVEAGLLRWIGVRLSIRSWVIASLRAWAKAMLFFLAAAVPIVLLIGVLAVSVSVRQQVRAAFPWLGAAWAVSIPTLFAWVIGGAQARILGAAGHGALAAAWRRVVTIGQLLSGALTGSILIVESLLWPQVYLLPPSNAGELPYFALHGLPSLLASVAGALVVGLALKRIVEAQPAPAEAAPVGVEG